MKFQSHNLDHVIKFLLFIFQVIFTTRNDTFDTLEKELRSGLYEKKYRISFENREIQQEFERLLGNRCLICDASFNDFNKLKDHVRKTHEKFYCEICTDALSLFSSERKFYSRSELARHRRIGDIDDKSHKGHPLCNYCELRFLDKDELWRHLRREHNYCHFCDADGVNLFYGTIAELRSHFKDAHYLCEEDECSEEGMAIAFRTEIDLRAHRSTVHLRTLTKQQARQARTLDIEFATRGRGNDGHGHGRRNNRDTQREFDDYNEGPPQPPPSQQITNNEEHFPALVSKKPIPQLSSAVRHPTPMYGSSRLAKTEENFPQLSLGGKNESVKVINNNQKSQASSSLFKQPQQTSAKSGKNANKNQQQNQKKNDFPALGQQKNNDFPALGPTSSNLSMTFTNVNVKKVAAAPKKTKNVVNNVEKSKPKNPMNSVKKNFDPEEDDYSGYPTLTPVPTGFNLKKSIKYDTIIDSYSVPQNHVSNQKIQSIQKKDDQIEFEKKSAPNLSSSSNFPSLGGESSLSIQPQQWVKKGNNNNNNQVKKIENFRGKPRPDEMNNQQVTKINKKYSYRAPTNADKRNLALAESFRKISQSNETLQEFKNVSQLYRQGGYYAKSYYETCQHILGSYFDRIFPELLVLLPSIDKQQVSHNLSKNLFYFTFLMKFFFFLQKQDLLTIHRKNQKNLEKSGAKPKKKSELELVECETCKQVLLNLDLQNHLQAHAMDENYPNCNER